MKVAVRSSDEVSEVMFSDRVSDADRDAYTEGELGCRRANYFSGELPLECFRATFPPGAEVRPHAHDSSEVIYVLEGELLLGSRRCGPGTAIYVGDWVLYGFRAGPEGLTFVNFRGVPASRYVTKAEYLEHRGKAP